MYGRYFGLGWVMLTITRNSSTSVEWAIPINIKWWAMPTLLMNFIKWWAVPTLLMNFVNRKLLNFNKKYQQDSQNLKIN
ncbi:hypothetical protein NUACC26_090800 [Scytonema sp. NUACC26]